MQGGFSYGNDIRNFRIEAGLSQEQLSTICDDGIIEKHGGCRFVFYFHKK